MLGALSGVGARVRCIFGVRASVQQLWWGGPCGDNDLSIIPGKYSWNSAQTLISKTIGRRVSDPPGKSFLMVPKIIKKNTRDRRNTFWTEFRSNPCPNLCFLSLVWCTFGLREGCRAHVGVRGIFLIVLGIFLNFLATSMRSKSSQLGE